MPDYKNVFILLMVILVFLACSSKANSNTDAVDQQSSAEVADDSLQTSGYQPGEWIESYETALAYAKANQKNLLLNFTGSDWCIWCIKLDKEVFSKDEFLSFARENLVLVKLDFPSRTGQPAELKENNQKLQKQFKVEGYPTIVLLNSEGREIARTGYQQGGAKNYISHLKNLMK